MCISNTFPWVPMLWGLGTHFETLRPRKIDNPAFPPSPSSFSLSFHVPLCPFLLLPPPSFWSSSHLSKQDGMSQSARDPGSSSRSVTD